MKKVFQLKVKVISLILVLCIVGNSWMPALAMGLLETDSVLQSISSEMVDVKTDEVILGEDTIIDSTVVEEAITDTNETLEPIDKDIQMPFGNNLVNLAQSNNSSYEESQTATGTAASWWSNKISPLHWNDMWAAAVPTKNPSSVYFSLDTEVVYDGQQSVRYTSGDNTGRFEIYTNVDNMSLHSNYIYSVKVKTENVSGTGVYLRLQTYRPLTSGNNSTLQTYSTSPKITGTTDGWTTLELPVQVNESIDIGRIRLEIFFEYLTGSVWIDDVSLVRIPKLSLNETEKKIAPLETFDLVTSCDDDSVDLSTVTYTSSDPTVLSVEGTGDKVKVVALTPGSATITANLGEYKVTCLVIVEDSSMYEIYNTVRQQWSDRLTGNNFTDMSDNDYLDIMSNIDKTAQVYIDSLINKPEGVDTRTTLWSDLNLTVAYKASSNALDSIDFNTAFERIYAMALAYASKGSIYYKNSELKNEITSTLEWMYTNVYNENYAVQTKLYGNWWHWQIGIPQNLANTIILMYDELDKDIIEKEVKALERFNENPYYVYKVQGWGKMDMTSANLMDTALVSALKSIISMDSKSISQAKEAISTVLPYVTSGDGFYEDGSCIQHNNLAYTGGYGATLLKGIEKILFLVNDTPWEVVDPNAINVYEWIWDGYRPLFADGVIMDMVSGRGIARPSRTDLTAGKGILQGALLLSMTAPDNIKSQIQGFVKKHLQSATQYDATYFSNMSVGEMTEAKNILNDISIVPVDGTPYFKMFSVMDKAVHHTPYFSLGISMYSNRTGSFEYGNGENIKGYHMSDGALFLYNGDQSQFSDNFWPTVDSMRLPGITTDHTEGTINSTWSAHTSTKSWVGGSLVLNLYGSVGMEFEIENSSLTGKKSWFNFDNEVVALGAGITSTENKDTETIVENRKINGDNILLINGTSEIEGVGTSKTVNKVSHAWLAGNLADGSDSIGYYFPEEISLKALRESRTGSWRDINSSVSETSEDAIPVVRNYLSLAIDHGYSPTMETYSYVLLPGLTTEETNNYQVSPDIEILSNTEVVQAVKEKMLNVSGYNFWSEGSVNGIASNGPSSVTMKETETGLILGISDPTQSQNSVTIILDSVYDVKSADSNVTVLKRNGQTNIVVNTTSAKGKIFSLELEKKDNSFSLLYNRAYQQVLGVMPNESLDLTNDVIQTYVSKLNTDANRYWNLLIPSTNSTRDRIFEGVKPVLAAGSNVNSADLTTTFQYLFKLTQAYATNGTDLYQNETVVTEVLSAIDFMINNKWYGRNVPKNSSSVTYYGNWWDHQIGVPAQLLPTIILLLDHAQFTSQRYAIYMDELSYQKANNWGTYTSANLADIGLNSMYYAILEQDSNLLISLKNRFGSELFSYVSSGNGWYKDGSYIDHSIYAYTGGYGSALISAMSRILPILTGTEFEMVYGDERDIFYDNILSESYIPLHFAGTIVDAVSGRSISREMAQYRTSVGQLAVMSYSLSPESSLKVKQIVKNWIINDETVLSRLVRPRELTACISILEDSSIISSKIPTGFYVYSAMDKVVKHANNYMAVISKHSSNIANYESINTEGYKLWNISDGALFLNTSDINHYRDGYWATVDLFRLPGITTLYNTARGNTTGAGTTNPNNWVGGTKLGEYGVTGLQITTMGNGATRDGVNAKKSWFMFDNEIVALGSDIQVKNSSLTSNVETVVENRRIETDLSNNFIINGEEVKIKDDKLVMPYLSIYAPAYDAANTAASNVHAHSLNYQVNKNAQVIKLETKMRFTDGKRNSALRFYGETEAGVLGVAYELFLNNATTGALKAWGGAGGDIAIDGRQWFTVEAEIIPATQTLTITITDQNNQVITKSGAFMASLNNPNKITSIGFYTSGTLEGMIDVAYLNIEEDDVTTCDIDFSEVTVSELSNKFFTLCANSYGTPWANHDHKTFIVKTKEEIIEKDTQDAEYNNVNWAYLVESDGNGIGYYFPEGETVKGFKESRTGKWEDINGLSGMRDSDDLLTRGYATMYIDHGIQPDNADYAYVLLPEASLDKTKEYKETPDVTIIANTEDVHAVYENNLNITAMNFWQGVGNVVTVDKVTSNGPATIMIQETSTGFTVSISDPTNSRSTMEIMVAIPYGTILSASEGIVAELSGENTVITVDSNSAVKGQVFLAEFTKLEPENSSNPSNPGEPVEPSNPGVPEVPQVPEEPETIPGNDGDAGTGITNDNDYTAVIENEVTIDNITTNTKVTTTYYKSTGQKIINKTIINKDLITKESTKTIEHTVLDREGNIVEYSILRYEYDNKEDIKQIKVDLTIPKETLEASKREGSSIAVEIKNDDGKEVAKWLIKNVDIKRQLQNFKDIKISFTITNVEEHEIISFNDKKQGGLVIKIDVQELDIPSQLQVYVKDRNTLNLGKKFYMYQYNTKANKFETIPYTSKLKVSKDGFAMIPVIAAGEYVLLSKKVPSNQQLSLLNRITAPTSYSMNKGEKIGITSNIPSTLSLVNNLKNSVPSGMGAVTISYQSSNEKVLKVGKDGTMTALKSGKATITLKVVLYSGKSKTIKIDVMVK